MTHVEMLDLERVPDHLIVVGGGYVGLELAQALRWFGSRVTVVEQGTQLAGREDPDVGAALLELLHDEGIRVLLGARITKVEGQSGDQLRVNVEIGDDKSLIEATDLLIAAGRTPTHRALALNQQESSSTRAGMSPSMTGSRLPRRASGRLETAPGARSSLTSPTTTIASCATT